MNIEDKLKQDAARIRDIKPPDNLRALLQASLEHIPLPYPRSQTKRLLGWFRPAAALASFLLIMVMVTAVFPLHLTGQPDPGDANILGEAYIYTGSNLVSWLALPGLVALAGLTHALGRQRVLPRVAVALLFIITLLAIILLMYNLVPSLRLEISPVKIDSLTMLSSGYSSSTMVHLTIPCNQ